MALRAACSGITNTRKHTLSQATLTPLSLSSLSCRRQSTSLSFSFAVDSRQASISLWSYHLLSLVPLPTGARKTFIPHLKNSMVVGTFGSPRLSPPSEGRKSDSVPWTFKDFNSRIKRLGLLSGYRRSLTRHVCYVRAQQMLLIAHFLTWDDTAC